MLAAIKLQLQAKLDAAFEHVMLLQEIRADTLDNLQDKNVTLDVDTEAYNATENDAGITLKPNATRVQSQ